MVNHQNVDLAVTRALQGGKAGRAAIDADDQAGAAVDQAVDRLRVGAVTLKNAVGDVDAGRAAERGEDAVEECRGGGAVHVVVAEDRHLPPGGDRVGETGG